MGHCDWCVVPLPSWYADGRCGLNTISFLDRSCSVRTYRNAFPTFWLSFSERGSTIIYSEAITGTRMTDSLTRRLPFYSRFKCAVFWLRLDWVFVKYTNWTLNSICGWNGTIWLVELQQSTPYLLNSTDGSLNNKYSSDANFNSNDW